MGSYFIRRPNQALISSTSITATWLCSFLLYGRWSTVLQPQLVPQTEHILRQICKPRLRPQYLTENTVSRLYCNHCNRSMTSRDSIVTGCDALGHSVTTTSITQGKLDSGPSYEGATYSNIHALKYTGVTP